MNEPNLTVEEVANALRVHAETVRVWLRRGEFPNAYRLPAKKSGWRIPQSDVEAFTKKDAAA